MSWSLERFFQVIPPAKELRSLEVDLLELARGQREATAQWGKPGIIIIIARVSSHVDRGRFLVAAVPVVVCLMDCLLCPSLFIVVVTIGVICAQPNASLLLQCLAQQLKAGRRESSRGRLVAPETT